MKNRTMMQMFEWYLPNDGSHWNNIKNEAKDLARTGINMVWLPPAYKGKDGIDDVGYAVYDTYDLGEFNQKGNARTKYGSKDEYLSAIRQLQKQNIEVLCDIVLNHRMGADYTEDVMAYMFDTSNRTEAIKDWQNHAVKVPVTAWTGFSFPGRQNIYSDFRWNARCFSGVDYDEGHRYGDGKVFLFDSSYGWDDQVDSENGNFDYLMGADINLDNEEVFRELVSWGNWYREKANMDGFRLDAVKHMCAPFYKRWVDEMRKPLKTASGQVIEKEMFTVGEYWSSDLGKLRSYIHQTQGAFSLFDVPLHMHFYEISNGNASFDMRKLFDNTLTGVDSWHSVTFVDNHDTQPGQSLSSFVNRWFKEIAYAIILLQEKGIPCVFYGDYYGIPHDGIEAVDNIRKLITLRQTHAYGSQHDYYDHWDIVGFTREGENTDQGLALICSDGPGGNKRMNVGSSHAGQTFKDALGHRSEAIVIDDQGWGDFPVNGGSVSVWIPDVNSASDLSSLTHDSHSHMEGNLNSGFWGLFMTLLKSLLDSFLRKK